MHWIRRIGRGVAQPTGERERLAAPTRFERATCPLGGDRSIQLSYGVKTVNYLKKRDDLLPLNPWKVERFP